MIESINIYEFLPLMQRISTVLNATPDPIPLFIKGVDSLPADHVLARHVSYSFVDEVTAFKLLDKARFEFAQAGFDYTIETMRELFLAYKIDSTPFIDTLEVPRDLNLEILEEVVAHELIEGSIYALFFPHSDYAYPLVEAATDVISRKLFLDSKGISHPQWDVKGCLCSPCQTTTQYYLELRNLDINEILEYIREHGSTTERFTTLGGPIIHPPQKEVVL